MTTSSGRPLVLRSRALALAVLIAGPAVWMVWRAAADPNIFLLPGGEGEWVRQIDQDVVTSAASESTEAEFRRVLDEATTEATTIRVRAFGTMQLSLDDEPIAPLTEGADWKHATSFVLPAGSRRNGVLSIRVRNAVGIPLLQVLDPPPLRTPAHWRAARGPSFTDAAPVASPLYRPPRPGPLQKLAAWRWLRYVVVASILGGVGLVAWVGWRASSFTKPEAAPRALAGAAAHWAPTFVIVTAAFINAVNAVSYPAGRHPLDWEAHADYVRYVARHWSVPQPSEGWEMYQPPLYYFCAALVDTAWRAFATPEHSMRLVQMIGVIAAAGLALTASRMVRTLMPQDPAATIVATVFAALVPMNVYMAPIVTNEVFAACAIALAIHLIVRALRIDSPSTRTALLAGVAAGAALLSKYTAVIVAAAGVLLLGVHGWRRRRLQEPLVFVLAATVSAGWLYLRNLLAYDNALIGNWDRASGFTLVQEPTFRVVGFFTDFGGVFFQHPTRSIWTSWFDGMYSTMWTDAHSVLMDFTNESAFFWMSVGLVVAFLPTLSIGLGFACTTVDAARDDDAAAFLVLACAWTWTALIWFALRVPVYSNVKAFYFLGLTPVLGVFLARGRRLLATHAPMGRLALDLSLAGVSALTVMVYARPQ